MSLLVAALVPLPIAAHQPAGLKEFMRALGQVESGGRYSARNAHSGAYGKYQIMPFNWPTWARRYLGDGDARPTPRNQERLARGKLTALYHWLGSWPNVAHWWLTGSSSRNRSQWSSYSRRYVDKVMRLYKEYGGGRRAGRAAPAPPATVTRTVEESSGSITYRGSWRSAHHGRYSGDTVRYATSRGATATFTFTGSAVQWVGPVGPTRGKARVYINGRYVRTVDLHAARFTARNVLFARTWTTSAERTLTIRVMGTPGRAMVAIDGFVVRD
ncbi:MAG TPA: hypothetical protein VFK38_06355 [Candidatus Limnocylindrales bacterium]|nr:hypothetical protein [Candidatus Limnocylindrales bacterium]